MDAEHISKLVQTQREYFATHATLSYEARVGALSALEDAIRRHEQDICNALYADLGKSSHESYMTEIGMTLSELTFHIKHLKAWMRPHRVLTSLANFPAKSFTVRDPFGVVLIMSPWNYPFMLTLDPLIGAISAGNCAIVKPSAYSPATSQVVQTIIKEVFDPAYVTCITGGRAENTALLDEEFDYIFFTGGTSVGKLVMEKASAHLTPISLELGGKSPCIITADARMDVAGRRVAFGKYLNCGQTCVAPDYVLVDEKVHDEFLGELVAAIRDMYEPKGGALNNPHWGHIVNDKHFERLCGLMDMQKVVYGGTTCAETLQITPTVMDHVSADDAIMQEEIFGPILPIITYDTLDEAIAFINARPKPLALYLFTEDTPTQERILSECSFGGGCINDTIMHLASTHMGFGGVGASGMGGYHGKKSFDTFTHEKSILHKATWLDIPLRYQPYTDTKSSWIRHFMR